MMTHSDLHAAQNRPISNAKLGVLVLLGAETMLFVGLIGAYLVFRMGNIDWPPLNVKDIQLPRVITGINTVLLVFSGISMYLATLAIRQGHVNRLRMFLLITGFFGLLFLGIQGSEWIQLISEGLTLQSGIYGGSFYVLIGCHAVHVLSAGIWLSIVLIKALAGRYSSDSYDGVETCMIYWTFVVGLWPILYILVYLY